MIHDAKRLSEITDINAATLDGKVSRKYAQLEVMYRHATSWLPSIDDLEDASVIYWNPAVIPGMWWVETRWYDNGTRKFQCAFPTRHTDENKNHKPQWRTLNNKKWSEWYYFSGEVSSVQSS